MRNILLGLLFPSLLLITSPVAAKLNHTLFCEAYFAGPNIPPSKDDRSQKEDKELIIKPLKSAEDKKLCEQLVTNSSRLNGAYYPAPAQANAIVDFADCDLGQCCAIVESDRILMTSKLGVFLSKVFESHPDFQNEGTERYFELNRYTGALTTKLCFSQVKRCAKYLMPAYTCSKQVKKF